MRIPALGCICCAIRPAGASDAELARRIYKHSWAPTYRYPGGGLRL